MKKIILINILLIIGIFATSEIISYHKLYDKYRNLYTNLSKMNKNFDLKEDMKYKSTNNLDHILEDKNFNGVRIKYSNKRPILIFGCSFANGFNLKPNQTFSSVLSNLTNRTVYDRTKCSTGTSFMYYQLTQDSFKKHVPDAEYIIYVMIYDHFNRFFKYKFYTFSDQAFPRYEIKNGKLSFIEPRFLMFYNLNTVRLIQEKIEEKKNDNTKIKDELFEKIMLESVKVTKNKYPNSKFILLVYPECNYEPNSEKSIRRNILIKNIEKKGVIVYNAEELVGHSLNKPEYIAQDGYHPSAKAWQEITPKLVQKLKI